MFLDRFFDRFSTGQLTAALLRSVLESVSASYGPYEKNKVDMMFETRKPHNNRANSGLLYLSTRSASPSKISIF